MPNGTPKPYTVYDKIYKQNVKTGVVYANDLAEGKVFKGWQDASGKIVSTNKSYTFTVTEATTLTAVYEDAPAAK